VSTVLVTGCSSGFGLGASLEFARRGHVTYASVRNLDKAGTLRQIAEQERLDLHVVRLDVTDPQSIEAAVAEILRESGAIDVVVNNAGIEVRGPVEEATDDEVLAQFETNVFGLLRVIRAVLPSMRERRSGVIVNVSSVAGLVARPFGGLYSASKHAVEALSEALHLELKQFGIRVAVVEPGQFSTALADNAIFAAKFDESSPYWEVSQRFDLALTRLAPGGAPEPDPVIETIVHVADDPDAPLRHVVGADAELIMSVRRAGDFEHYEETMRDALEWWD
jgi:NAD(P)-dependent dehydrogenase (short-subunit alcohol dehydrogenase family)